MVMRADVGKRGKDTAGRSGLPCAVIKDYGDPDDQADRRKRTVGFLRPGSEGGR